MVPDSTRNLVRQRAKHLCEYCHSPEYLSPDRFTLDHINPRSLGGSNELENLALACHRCNQRHYNFTDGVDPDTQSTIRLFHPRQMDWAEHFIWTVDGIRIIGTTAIGRATCQRLDLNDDFHNNGAIQQARWIWVSSDWHPPDADPQQ